MRPSSASYYLDDLINITHDFISLVQAKADTDNTIDDLLPFIYRYAMEAVTAVFLDSRLGCLDDPLGEEAEKLIHNVNILVGEPLVELLLGLPIWKLIKTKPYKTYDDATQIIYDISGKLIEAGQKKHLEQSKFKKVLPLFTF